MKLSTGEDAFEFSGHVVFVTEDRDRGAEARLNLRKREHGRAGSTRRGEAALGEDTGKLEVVSQQRQQHQCGNNGARTCFHRSLS